MIKHIVHPTDLSPQGEVAFHHALALALANKARLDLIHVHDPAEPDHFERFPKVREVLGGWGVLPAGATVEDIAQTTGVTVGKVEIRDVDAVEGMMRFLGEHRPDLVVMASHGRGAVGRWLAGSISAELMHDSHLPTLLFGPGARGFIDPGNGALRLGRVAVPVDHDPSPAGILRRLEQLLGNLSPQVDLFHAGDPAPEVHDGMGGTANVRLVGGTPVEAILAEAANADLLAMPTAGRKGLLDMLRGSTTERVLHDTPCALLALPPRDMR